MYLPTLVSDTKCDMDEWQGLGQGRTGSIEAETSGTWFIPRHVKGQEAASSLYIDTSVV